MNISAPTPDELNQYNQLVDEVNRHNHLFFVLASPEISDIQYDALYKTIEEFEERYSSFVRSDSPTQYVEPDDDYGDEKITYNNHSRSLKKTHSVEEILHWLSKVRDNLNTCDIDIGIELKYDGLHARLVYVNGLLVEATTRGRNGVANNILAAVRKIPNVPTIIPHRRRIEMRGEIVVDNDFIATNPFPAEYPRGEDSKSLRNYAAGAVRKASTTLKSDRTRLSPLRYVVCEVLCDEDNPLFDSPHRDNHVNRLAATDAWGFVTSSVMRMPSGNDGFTEQFETILSSVNTTGRFDIDGLVIKLIDNAQREIMGTEEKYPNWAISYKFSNTMANTTVVSPGIVYDVGKNNRIIPVLTVYPTIVSGACVSRISIGGWGKFDSLNLGIGDVVEITRANEIIPYISKKISSSDQPRLEMPSTCPACNSELIRTGDVLSCTNHSCKGALVTRITHWCSRSGVGIDGLGPNIIQQLVDSNSITSIPDIYNLSVNDYAKILSARVAKKLVDASNKSLNTSSIGMLVASGISGCGAAVARAIVNNYGTVRDLLDALSDRDKCIEEISNLTTGVSRIGTVASVIVDSLIARKLELERLLTIMKIDDGNVVDIDLGIPYDLDGKVVSITGSFKYPRRLIEGYLRSKGAIVSSVSKRTAILLMGNNPTVSKADAVIKYGGIVHTVSM